MRDPGNEVEFLVISSKLSLPHDRVTFVMNFVVIIFSGVKPYHFKMNCNESKCQLYRSK